MCIELLLSQLSCAAALQRKTVLMIKMCSSR